MISYKIYIIPIISIMCFLGYLLKRYYNDICSFLSMYKSKNKINISNRVKIIKDKYSIKSTEKTNINSNLKFIVKKPTHLKINKIIDMKININKNKNDLNDLLKDNYNKKIICSYIYNKNKFINLFQNEDGTKKIINLTSFNIYHKKNLHNNINSNILLKFYK